MSRECWLRISGEVLEEHSFLGGGSRSSLLTQWVRDGAWERVFPGGSGRILSSGQAGVGAGEEGTVAFGLHLAVWG